MPADVIEDLDGWTFPVRGLRIVGVTVDHRVRLHLEAETTITVAGPFQLGGADASSQFDVRAPSSLGPVLGLVHGNVDHARASWSGLLRIAISTGNELVVPPSTEVEAWQVALADGVIYLARPGVGVISLPAKPG